MNSEKDVNKNRWHRYWFSYHSSVGFAIFRAASGIILLLYHTPRLWYLRELYTADGYLVPMDPFRWLSLPVPNIGEAIVLNSILHLAIITFTIGYRTRTSMAIIFVLHAYFSLLEYFSTIGLGIIMTIYHILALFSPLGSFLSLDYARTRSREIAREPAKLNEPIIPPSVPITMQRVMLWQLAVIYFFNVLAKLTNGGWGWLNGGELWRIYMNDGQATYSFMPPLIAKIAFLLPHVAVVTIAGLTLLAIGIPIPALRPYALIFGVTYHTVAIFTILAPITFSLFMLSLYLIAIEPAAWARWWDRWCNTLSKKRLALRYDDRCGFCQNAVAWIRALDFFNVVTTQGSGEGALMKEIELATATGVSHRGFFAVRRLAWSLPHGWLALPFLYLPGMQWLGPWLYRWVARNRYNLCRSCQ